MLNFHYRNLREARDIAIQERDRVIADLRLSQERYEQTVLEYVSYFF